MNVKKWMAGLMVAFLAVLSLALPLPGTSTAPLLEAIASSDAPFLVIEPCELLVPVSEAAGQTVSMNVYLDSPALTRFLLMLRCDERLQDVEIESVMEQLPEEYTAFSKNHLDSDNYSYTSFLWKSTEERSFDEMILRMTVTLPEDVEPGDTFSVSYLSSSPLTGEVCEWNNTLTGMQYADSVRCQNCVIMIVEDPVISGTCGDDLTWELNESTKILTISGTGDMRDYFITNSPLYKLEFTSAVIEDGVTSIGDAAFYGCESLTSVTIPDSVTSIKYGAFEYCTSLTSVTILDPDCEICDSSSTICNDYDGDYFFTGTIYGYENSTAQAYAEKYGYAFTSIGAAPEPTPTLGDLDGDGCITIFDLGLMKNGVKNGFTTASMIITADVDQNGIIEEEDVRLLQAFLLGRK